MSTRVERYGRSLAADTTKSVRSASALKTQSRIDALPVMFADPDQARDSAAATKEHVLDHLKSLLTQFESKCQANGIVVHWASDGEAANAIVLDLCRKHAPDGSTIVKAKSMVTEEIHLNRHLEEAGYLPVETDLGEFVVQIDHDTPSHIVTPIIHKNRVQVAGSFLREGLGPYTESPEELAGQARKHLRSKFQEAKIGISGVNFGIASSGRLVLVENEGNNRLSTTAPDIHIALMGIEKILPDDADLAVFLPLLAGSATGQRITTYVHLIQGPRRDDEADGPREVHLILLDNGRTGALSGAYRDILRCIRCGACLNVCPVYRQASGHAYGHVYSGPVGAVLAPVLDGVEAMGDLPMASTLCGACEAVCPVRIPLPKMLIMLRDQARRAGVNKDPIPWRLYATGATNGRLWRAGLKMLPIATNLPHPLKKSWLEFRELPKPQGRDFRRWWHGRS